MPEITALATRRGAVTAEFDDGSELRCSTAFAAGIRLHPGDRIDAAVLERLRESAAADLAAATARSKARRRPTCRSELAQHLARRGFSRPAIDAALDALAAEGEIDEAAYAIRHARKRRRAGAAASLIRAELRAKGIKPADIAPAVDDEDDERTAAAWIARSSRDDDWKRRRLRRMGFPYSLIRTLLPDEPEPAASAAGGNAIG